jgi:hypothetical protein
MKTLIYLGVYLNKDYVDLLYLCLKSLEKFSKPSGTTDVLVYTSPDLKDTVMNSLSSLSYPVMVCITDGLTSICDGLGSKFRVFNFIDCFQYERILYIDTDVLVANSLDVILTSPLKDDTVYAMKEGRLDNMYFCRDFFDFTKVDGSITSVNAGIFMFKPSDKVRKLFSDIYTDLKSNRVPTAFVDQAYFAYHVYINNCYDNEFLTPLIGAYGFTKETPQKPLYHFIGPYVGGGAEKRSVMTDVFYNKLH